MAQERPREEVVIPATAKDWSSEEQKRHQMETTGMHPVYSRLAKGILDKVNVSEPETTYNHLYIPKLSRRQLAVKALGTLGALSAGDIFMNRSQGVDAAFAWLPSFSYDRVATEVLDGIRPDAIYAGVVTIYSSDMNAIKEATGEDINFSYDTHTFNDVSIDIGRPFTIEGAQIVYFTKDHQKTPMMKFSISEGDYNGDDYFSTVGYLKANFLMDEDPISSSRRKELVPVKPRKDGKVFFYDGTKYVPYTGKIGVVSQPPATKDDIEAVSS